MGKFDWQKFWISFMNNVGLIMLAVALLLFIFVPLLSLNDDNSTTITFNITGVDTNNTLTNSTIVSLGIDCIKVCNGKFYDIYSKLELCYDQCTKVLGCG